MASLMAMKRIFAPDQGLHDLDHLREAAAEPRQLADQQTVAGLERPQHFVDAALERTVARRDAGLDELVDREAAFLAELEDRQLLVGEIDPANEWRRGGKRRFSRRRPRKGQMGSISEC